MILEALDGPPQGSGWSSRSALSVVERNVSADPGVAERVESGAELDAGAFDLEMGVSFGDGDALEGLFGRVSVEGVVAEGEAALQVVGPAAGEVVLCADDGGFEFVDAGFADGVPAVFGGGDGRFALLDFPGGGASVASSEVGRGELAFGVLELAAGVGEVAGGLAFGGVAPAAGARPELVES